MTIRKHLQILEGPCVWPQSEVPAMTNSLAGQSTEVVEQEPHLTQGLAAAGQDQRHGRTLLTNLPATADVLESDSPVPAWGELCLEWRAF